MGSAHINGLMYQKRVPLINTLTPSFSLSPALPLGWRDDTAARALAILPEDLGLVPSTRVGLLLTAASNYRARTCCHLLPSLVSCVHAQRYRSV